MKNKRIFKTFSALCAALVLMMGLSVTAFAQGTDQPPAEDATNDANVVVEETEDSPALTPDGNAALVDDFGGNKQLITVTTKAGNYFYILIDRANEDKETAVHFLNQVDEADLMALICSIFIFLTGALTTLKISSSTQSVYLPSCISLFFSSTRLCITNCRSWLSRYAW